MCLQTGFDAIIFILALLNDSRVLVYLAVLVGQLLLEVCEVYGILVLGLKKLEGDCSRGVLKFERFLEDGIRRLRNLCYKRGRVLKTASLNAREEEGSSGIGNVEKAEALRDIKKVEGLRVDASSYNKEEIRYK